MNIFESKELQDMSQDSRLGPAEVIEMSRVRTESWE